MSGREAKVPLYYVVILRKYLAIAGKLFLPSRLGRT